MVQLGIMVGLFVWGMQYRVLDWKPFAMMALLGIVIAELAKPVVAYGGDHRPLSVIAGQVVVMFFVAFLLGYGVTRFRSRQS